MIDSKHPYALKNVVRVPEENNEMSMTIPDMCLSADELYKRYRLGTLPADLVRQVLYDESDDFDSVLAEYLPAFDLVDVDRELVKLRQKFEVMHNINTNASRDVSPSEDKRGASANEQAPATKEQEQAKEQSSE